jgi:hypothetical protein
MVKKQSGEIDPLLEPLFEPGDNIQRGLATYLNSSKNTPSIPQLSINRNSML